jgi:hypothetical protein
VTVLGPQWLPAHEIRSKFRPEPHELYSENTGRPWMHEDDATNLQMTRDYKLSEAHRLQWEDEPEGPDNQSLVGHIRSNGFPGSVLLDRSRNTVIDGNHRLEAAHHLDPNYPVPVTYKR